MKKRGKRPGHSSSSPPKEKSVKGDLIEVEGVVVETLPNTMFKVKLPEHNDHTLLAHLSGRSRVNHIKVILGDRVKVEISPYDLSRGRITYRMR